MDLFETMRTRKSIRKYKPEPIPEEKLNMIYETAQKAPSVSNRQPWRFIVVQDPKRKKALSEIADQSFLNEAAAIIVATGDPTITPGWYEKDTMIATEHMILAATALGYGTCWIGAFDEGAVKRLLKIPKKVKVVALFPIGVSDEKPAPRSRKELSEIIFKEEWRQVE